MEMAIRIDRRFDGEGVDLKLIVLDSYFVLDHSDTSSIEDWIDEYPRCIKMMIDI